MWDEQSAIESWLASAQREPAKLGGVLERYRSFLILWSKQEMNSRIAADCGASDIVQETFREACRDFGDFRGKTEAEFTVWLKQIHRHNLIDHLRRLEHGPCIRSLGGDVDCDRTITLLGKPAARQTSLGEIAVRGEDALRVADCLLQLPANQAEAVRLRYLEGWPLGRIAEELNVSRDAVAGYLKRGLQKLRERLAL
jgi:RNA polymerase sigma-70 factor, ECF subfamily